MRQFGIDFALFILFAIGSLVCLGVTAQLHPRLENQFFARHSYDQTYLRMSDFIETTGPHGFDILHLGSSTCYRGINPRAFSPLGHTSFNLCSSSQTFFNSRYLLEWSVQLNPEVRAVTLDVYPAIWSNSGTESSRDLIVNHKHIGQNTFQKMAWATGDPLNIVLAAYFGIKHRLKPMTVSPKPKSGYKKGGFTFSNYPPTDSIKCNTITANLSKRQERAFKSIRTKCTKHNIPLILLNPPQLCEELFEKPDVMEGLPWIEGNAWPLAKVDTLYYDEHHLRGVGAELYSEWLAQQVHILLN